MLIDDGLPHLQILGVFAAKESANIGRWVTRKLEAVAANDDRTSDRCAWLGYADEMTRLPDHAGVYRTLKLKGNADQRPQMRATRANRGVVPGVGGDPQRGRSPPDPGQVVRQEDSGCCTPQRYLLHGLFALCQVRTGLDTSTRQTSRRNVCLLGPRYMVAVSA